MIRRRWIQTHRVDFGQTTTALTVNANPVAARPPAVTYPASRDGREEAGHSQNYSAGHLLGADDITIPAVGGGDRSKQRHVRLIESPDEPLCQRHDVQDEDYAQFQ